MIGVGDPSHQMACHQLQIRFDPKPDFFPVVASLVLICVLGVLPACLPACLLSYFCARSV
jgi:hypothetical protein